MIETNLKQGTKKKKKKNEQAINGFCQSEI